MFLSICRNIAIGAALWTAGADLSAQAAMPFEPSQFTQAQRSGRTIIVDVTAPWCPICLKQKPALTHLENTNPQLVVFEVDFFAAKDIVRRLNIQTQSTLIVYRGSVETARSVGLTNPAAIRSLVATAN